MEIDKSGHQPIDTLNTTSLLDNPSADVHEKLLPPEHHPNYRLWANYANFARARGELVADLLESCQPLANLQILDAGFGMGGTALALLARGAKVVALEFSSQKTNRLKRQTHGDQNCRVLQGSAQQLALASAAFDWVIFQDVLEHLHKPQIALAEASRVLKPSGRIYISTPNRWAVLNLISDPHWNLPVVAALPRRGVEFFITKLVRRESIIRQDFAALFSLRQLRQWLAENQFRSQFVHNAVVQNLFSQPTSVVNSDAHLALIRLAQKLHLEKTAYAIVNERFGLFNHLINPTWYLIAQKIG
jgi:SAM-dependent methyltransferase